MLELILLFSVMMIIPKIIQGVKEGVKFVGRFVGWGLAIFIVILLIKKYLL